jgi:hypothetical protein
MNVVQKLLSHLSLTPASPSIAEPVSPNAGQIHQRGFSRPLVLTRRTHGQYVDMVSQVKKKEIQKAFFKNSARFCSVQKKTLRQRTKRCANAKLALY